MLHMPTLSLQFHGPPFGHSHIALYPTYEATNSTDGHRPLIKGNVTQATCPGKVSQAVEGTEL
jgi:hypothetical protein